ncbi:MAG TPA: hypothetical protein VMI10_07185 [Terriglobales bacterium]|nr:hypothetical protein [Terriglobales bacterium]
MLLGVGSAINTYYSGRKSAAQYTQDEKQIIGLKSAVEAANKAQEANTKIFVKSFDEMSQKLSGLDTQLKTAGLQKEAAQLRTDLETTRKALSPPQAEFAATFGHVTEALDNLDITETPITQSPDGVLDFTVWIINKSKVQAKNGSIALRICTECRYAEEPESFTKLPGSLDYDRTKSFTLFEAATGLPIHLRVKAPPKLLTPIYKTQIDVTVRCENCMFQPKLILFVKY